MANAAFHRLAGGAAAFCVLAHAEREQTEKTLKPVVGGSLAAVLSTLPDLIEPALNNPHHRQFFHSVAWLAIISAATAKIYDWKPEDDRGKALRFVLLIAIGAYATHLGVDAFSKRSLPWLGKL